MKRERSQMEQFDIYDSRRKKTGKIGIRGVPGSKEEFQLVVHVCFFNKEGKMLIQKRAETKTLFPGLWDVSVGGSVLSGEDSQSAAEREVQEELGHSLNLEGIRPSMTVNFDLGFDDIYLIEEDIPLSALKLQADEVEEVMWASPEDIYRLIDTGEFLPYRKGIIAAMFEMRGSMGFFDCHYLCYTL